jgi:hypothetical protein
MIDCINLCIHKIKKVPFAVANGTFIQTYLEYRLFPDKRGKSLEETSEANAYLSILTEPS